ncbi:MAG: hypothetical protein ACRDPD_19450 [Streptosporangiaceae bacterium]
MTIHQLTLLAGIGTAACWGALALAWLFGAIYYQSQAPAERIRARIGTAPRTHADRDRRRGAEPEQQRGHPVGDQVLASVGPQPRRAGRARLRRCRRHGSRAVGQRFRAGARDPRAVLARLDHPRLRIAHRSGNVGVPSVVRR